MDNTIDNTIEKETASLQEPQKKIDSISIKINVKIAVIVAAVVLIVALAYTFKGLFIVAIVDGNPISRLEIIRELERISGKSLLDSLVVEKLIENEANTKKIAVTQDEINVEIKKIENQLSAQGSTLADAIASQNMTMEDLKKQIVIQKKIEKLVADKINVTDEEVAQYIVSNKITMPVGQEATTTAQIKESLKNEKLGTESNLLITGLRSQAKISYFVKY